MNIIKVVLFSIVFFIFSCTDNRGIKSVNKECVSISDSAFYCYLHREGRNSKNYMELVDRAIRCDSSYYNAWAYKASFLYQDSLYEESLKVLKKMFDLFPSNPDGYITAACCYYFLSDTINYNLYKGKSLSAFSEKFQQDKMLPSLIDYLYVIRSFTGQVDFELIDKNKELFPNDEYIDRMINELEDQETFIIDIPSGARMHDNPDSSSFAKRGCKRFGGVGFRHLQCR